MADDKTPEEMLIPGDIKNLVSQVLSPYFDDEGDVQHTYDHNKSVTWIRGICDSVVEKLVRLRKPYKYVVHMLVMRKCGAGMHVCSSCYYTSSDGWMSHAYDLSPWLYCVVTVYWSTI